MSAAAPPAAMAEELEATRRKKMRKHREPTEVAGASSESPRPPATPDSKPESPAPVAPETLTSTAVAAGKERKRKKLEVAAASPLVEGAVGMEEKKKRGTSKHEEAAATQLPSAAVAASQVILGLAAEGAMARKERRRGKVKQGQSGQPPLPVDVHPQGGEAAVDGGVCGSQSVKRSSSSKPRVLSNREILRMRIIELRKKQPMPQGFVPAMANPNSIDQVTFFDQFCYKSDRQQGRNAPSLPKTPDRPVRLPPRDHPPSLSSQLTANVTFMAAKTTTSTTKQPCSASASGPKEEVKVKEKKRPEKKMSRIKTPRKPSPVPLPQCSMSVAAMAEELEVTRQKKMRKHRVPMEVAGASSESPRPPATPDSKPESPAPVAPETLTSTAVAAGKERKRKKLEVAAASPLVEGAVGMEEKMKRKTSKHVEAADPAAVAASQVILGPAVEGAMVSKERRRRKVKQGQSGQPPLPVDVHPQGREAAADGGVCGSQSVKRSSSSKLRVLSNREMLRMRIIELRKKQPMLQGFIPAMANPNSIDQDPNHSPPLDAFFDQFCYKSDRRQGCNAPSLPKTPDRPVRPPPRDHPPSLSSQLTANVTFMAAKTTISTTKQPRSASASGPKEEVKVKEKKRPEKKMSRIMTPRKPSPVLRAAEKLSDKYLRLPLNQLVPPPPSPHKLLQERYADDPWKVIVICMLLNLTQGKQVRKIVEGFFELYPDAQTACTADPEMMAKYLEPLGLQNVKTERIQKFSKAYVGDKWTHITQLCGVGKYAADAYAIFCAGRATEVVPKDHKLVDYWKYVCFELPLTQ
ncbi:Methyl-CpG-binding domain protein 4-like protein, partial [Dichanthelium oligosanthes]